MTTISKEHVLDSFNRRGSTRYYDPNKKISDEDL